MVNGKKKRLGEEKDEKVENKEKEKERIKQGGVV